MNKVFRLYCILLLAPMSLLAAPGSNLEFIQNKGQWAGPFLYKATNGNSSMYLEKNCFTYVTGAQENIAQIQDYKIGKIKTGIFKFHAYKVIFDGANTDIDVYGTKAQQHYYNYFLNNDPNKWKTGIHPNLAVDYSNVYNNIDIHVSSENDVLKYDVIVHPGANAEQVKFRYVGTDGLKIQNSKLQIKTSVGTVEELKPYAYQYVNGERKEVYCRYQLKDNVVSFSMPDGYDTKQDLIIDPTIVFATFTGSSFDNWGYTATYDASGNFYAGGITGNGQGGTGYPTTVGAYQTTWGGGGSSGNGYPVDISITKFNAAGNSMVYSTYLGGVDNEQPHSMFVDGSGNLVVAGRTYSNNFPTTAGCYDNSYNGGGDMIVTIFNPSGTALIGSTYIGGSGEDVSNFSAQEFVAGNLKHNYGDDARSEVILDNSGNIYIAACTKSTNFPTTASALKTTLNSGDAQDAVVLKLNSNATSLIWSTYLGGNSDDAAYVLALDNTQSNLFVAGGTMSSEFPVTSGVFTGAYQGNTDGFICKFQNSGSYSLLRSTFIGKSGYDQCFGLQIDANNNVYSMGQTLGGTFPVSAGVYSNANSSQFIIKLDNNLTTNLLSTVYGSGNSSATNISPVAFLVDLCGNIYISGWGGDIYTSAGGTLPPGVGNTNGMPVGGLSGPAAQSTTDGNDFYFIVLSQNMSSLLYATYMGRVGGVCEHVDGGTSRFDRDGVVYQAICGGCGGGTFPTTAGSWSPTNKSNNCNEVALKIAFNLGPVIAKFTINPSTVVCFGNPVTITNGSTNVTTYLWDFGDGSPTFAGSSPPPHLYTSVGTFTIKLKVTNPTSCNLADSMSLTVKVDSNSIKAAFVPTIIDTCAPFTASFSNTSKPSKTPGSTVYFWDFGDGSNYTGQTPSNHNFPKGGTYTVKLKMTDPTACNSPDSTSATLTFRDDNVKAVFEVPPLICIADSFIPSNTSVNATNYLWKFGDNKTSTQTHPYHRYDSTGTYKVTLYAYNPNSCNKVDSMSRTIDVRPSPTADFTFTPVVPVTNEPTAFTNMSKNAYYYNWNFGDGTGTAETNPTHFWKRTGTYNVCLIATNKEGCTDTICKPVSADVLPLADIPNAFSPNGDGNNDILFVRGAAIQSMNVKVYNRWGEKVFESSDMKVGWDGTYKGKPQEMEVYAYVLNVTFVDETTLYKKGNITLLR
ncbi:MAG: PKD domain-containing protein [Bacteroidetes bacterium]|nr:PKD domain-containing protein [Bacteroidota bacterium]